MPVTPAPTTVPTERPVPPFHVSEATERVLAAIDYLCTLIPTERALAAGLSRDHAAHLLTRIAEEDRARPVPVAEYFVEVTWVDHVASGAKGPTSRYGPLDAEIADRFEREQRLDSAVAATRILTRAAAYTDLVGPEPVEVTPEERERLKQEWIESLWSGFRTIPAATEQLEDPDQ